uniref:Pyrokinin-3 n=8 Tax=Austrophasmatidae TaxID=409164 RepID=PPK3_AUSGA|nr:RecName: Full=Pyrokinin-3; Short=PK-3; AltName: Full=FXPRL-amide [Namaquaphasma ookiepense]B0M3B9.1 RecName: Full=Pyrokinin-3; Short=PK-3; AltName: Full=FXPRL-amide [Striatophasma naukluftense]B3A055.1 RecName: Full=Pyrokinin-3; Short=PK-3; AltName: Full=FXPRL-amide [Karoophasma botterkloofense]B3A074.1 RecName: Full=Pyrokinin-3; Short=PK-3; AltName: Full=FXPRL-amide [Karoophasma biedouwense]B3A093.1 RecName: Full=Pyrokinin-3; Short=PK-3; AltName: Full=FXPRL-amide [Lobatophasma redelinghuyse
DPPFSPRL